MAPFAALKDPAPGGVDPADADVTLPGGDHCHIRQMHNGDEAMLREMFAHCSENDIYLRCFAAMKNFPDQMAARLAHMDPSREIALVAQPPVENPDRILGVAHVILDHEQDLTAEFDVVVRSDEKGHGIGYALMTALLVEARRRGFAAVIGYVLRENRAMMQMAGELGFVVVHVEGGEGPPAGGLVAILSGHFGPLDGAALDGDRTARVEDAAGRRREGGGHLTLQHDAFLGMARIGDRRRRHQGTRIGVERAREDLRR
eukprot:gene24977-26968_t